jgi:hypothetical protein
MENLDARPLLLAPPPAPCGVDDGAKDRPLSMMWMSDELIAKTQRVWSPLYGRAISGEEAMEILSNVKCLADVGAGWETAVISGCTMA